MKELALKRTLLFASFVAALFAAAVFSGGGTPALAARPTPTPSAAPLPIPTASPEPPNIAIPRLEQKLKTNPDDRLALIELAGQFLDIGHPEATLPLTQHLLQLGDKTAQVYYLDGSAQEAANNIPGALSDLENASNLEPTNIGVLTSLTSLYIKANRTQDAERVANRAVTFNKTEPKAYVNLGIVYATEQKWDDARKQFEQAYTLDPKDTTPLIQIAQTWVAQNSLPTALTAINRAILADPRSIPALLFRADVYVKQRDVARAASAYDDASAAATTDADKAAILVRKAIMYAGFKQTAQAEGVFETAIKQYPLVSTIHTAYGEYWVAGKQPARAETQFLTALQTDKTDVTALLDLANLKQSEGRQTDAIRYLKQLTNVAPSGQAYALLGQAYVAAHDYSQARDACGRSFQIDRTPDTLGCVAGSDYSLKNYKEASRIFAILDKNVRPYVDRNPQILYMMGASYAKVGQKSQALDAYKRLLKMMRPGTKAYKDVQVQIAMLSKRPPAKKKKHV